MLLVILQIVVFISCALAIGLSACILNAYYKQKKDMVLTDKTWSKYKTFAWTATGTASLIAVAMLIRIGISLKYGGFS